MSDTPIKPKAHTGMRHLALFVKDFDACLHFYCELLDMKVEWQPDDDNIYLCSGNDNLALHRVSAEQVFAQPQKLDHIGFIINDIDQVDVWYEYLLHHQVKIQSQPRTHRDGARSFYCVDPDGTLVQMIYHPPLVIPAM